MHEWALAESVIEATLGHAQGRAVSRVVLRLGALQRVEVDVFRTALTELATERGSLLSHLVNEKSALQLVDEPAALHCNRCGHRHQPTLADALDDVALEAVHFLPEAAVAHLRCPRCGSPDFRIVAGRGVTIATIELEEVAERGTDTAGARV